MPNHYGIERVLEPKGFVPATAFKLDNSKTINKNEIRISLERIQIDWNYFRQICNSCGFDESRIINKIMGLIETHGKIHNPFYRAGGSILGTVNAIGSEVTQNRTIRKNIRVFSTAPLNSVPLFIDEISGIDYNYGQIICTGYAIIFDYNQIIPIPDNLSSDYTLAVLNEGGSIYAAQKLASGNNSKNIVILGRNEHITLLYAAALRFNNQNQYNITCIIDDSSKGPFQPEEIKDFLHPYVNEIYFADISQPLDSYKKILAEPTIKDIDQIIVAEDIHGAVTLSVMLSKPGGYIFFTSAESHYSDAQIIADSLNKNINLYTFTDCNDDYSSFILDFTSYIQTSLKKIDDLFIKKKTESLLTGSISHRIKMMSQSKDNEFVYQSPVTKNMVDEVLNIAKFDCNVIIQGETGVGKEKVLTLIHQHSDRANKPCVKINCATIHENLAESEFFGYESGAFTGAQANGKIGYFELANHGILFLDEIGSLSLNMQSKLLRVLQENQFYRVGGTTQLNVDVRVICANNVPLQEIVEKGEFREDLYYRLNICKINVPPLRERKDDILCLSEAFVTNCAQKYKIEKELSDGAIHSLYNYSWPGNVRELENVIHRLIISSRGTIITSEDVDSIINEAVYLDKSHPSNKKIDESEFMDFHKFMERQEKKIIEYALNKGKTTRKAADLIGLPQTTFARKKAKYGL